MANAGRPSELSKINDPNFVIELAVGPPLAPLVPQQPGAGLSLGGRFLDRESRFIFKKAHLSADDNRIFDAAGRLVLCSHHYGKNPYGSLDPLGLSGESTWWQNTHILGEWDSICHVTGYRGMPSFKVRPKTMSMHGRQFIIDSQGTTHFNIAKQSRLKSLSIRHNLVVCRGDTEEDVYTILVDLAGRTMQLVNEKEERIAFIQKSLKTMIMNASFGAGSELMIDVAPGVDWTAVLAIVIGLKQVGEHFVKDAVSNFVVSPAQNVAQDYVLNAAGLDGVSGQIGQFTDTGLQTYGLFQQLMNAFYN